MILDQSSESVGKLNCLFGTSGPACQLLASARRQAACNGLQFGSQPAAFLTNSNRFQVIQAMCSGA